MPIRDLFLFAITFGAIPWMLRHPYIGVLFWVWIGMMNPHRSTWGFAYSFPFGMLVAAVTMIGILVTKDERRFKTGPEVWVLLLMVIWFSVTLLFAFNPDPAFEMWKRVMKIQFMVFVALFLLNGKRHVDLLIWVLALSVAFFGIKGGIFTLAGGGGHRVFGPADSFIADNNALALALVMTIPLLNYLRTQVENKWVRHGLVLGMILCGVAVLGSHSRGALLGVSAMLMFLWWRSRAKLPLALALLVLAPLLVVFMPDHWMERMSTIRDYEQDTSAMGRINAWTTAINVANDRLVGGGFVINSAAVFERYAPDPTWVLTAHSIYFQALGEHGWVGLALFLLLWAITWSSANKLIKAGRSRPDVHWASDLGAMIQVSLVGFGVGGAFLSLTYWDFPYYEVVAIVVARDAVRRALASDARTAGRPLADPRMIAPAPIQPSQRR